MTIPATYVQDGRLRGRLRTGVRAVPASATDVATTDMEGDVLNDSTYFYRLVNISGTLKWHRVVLSVAW